MHTLRERLELEKRNRKPEEIKDLNLDNSKATEIEGLTDEYVNLESLSLIHVGLQSLKGLPKLPSLKKLELSDNNIASGLEILVDNTPEIEQLVLTNNKIKDLETLKPLAKLKKLTSLDLFSCAVSNTDTFREDVFNLLPQLKYLDGFDIDNQEEPDEEYEEEEDDEDDDYQGSEDEEGGDESGSEYEQQGEDEDDESSNLSDAEKVRPAGKVGMNNHVQSDEGDEEYSDGDGDDDEEDEEYENDALAESFGEEDDEEVSPSRGTKRKYPVADDDGATGDSATNE